MKTIMTDKLNFQGDVMIRKISSLPKEVVPVHSQDTVIIAHSETGHHHSFNAGENVWLYSTKDQMTSYLEVKAPAVLRHRRDFDTHEMLQFPVGIYEIRRQREYTPEGWRQVTD